MPFYRLLAYYNIGLHLKAVIRIHLEGTSMLTFTFRKYI